MVRNGYLPPRDILLHDIWMAPTRAEAEKAFDLFLKGSEAKYPNATECLDKLPQARESLISEGRLSNSR